MSVEFDLRSSRGIALIVTLLAIALFSTLGLGLVLSSSTTRLADHNHDEAVAMLNAAESALELAVRDLSAVANFNQVLDGSVQSSAVDGPPGPRRLSDGSLIDLSRLTNQLTCELDTVCSDAQVQASSAARPWGPNNPRWRLFVYLPLTSLVGATARTAPYVIVWIGDDPREIDGNPLVDGGGMPAEGRYVLRARAEAFGAHGARRAIDAELARICRHVEAGEVCLPTVTIQSWRVIGAVP